MTLEVSSFPLSPPSLEDIAGNLQTVLSSSFQSATVSVVTSPNFTEAPFYLAAEGLAGDARVVDVGGPGNLYPLPLADKSWSLKEVAKAIGLSADKGSLLGAAGGPYVDLDYNTELAASLSWEGEFDNLRNEARYIQVTPSGDIHVDKSPSDNIGLMGNFYGSLGEPGLVLKIEAEQPYVTNISFSETVRQGVHSIYGDDVPISLGGVFLVKSGNANYHIMPNFPPASEVPWSNTVDFNNWLQWRDFDSPVVCLSVLHSADPGLRLRLEHSHCFSRETDSVGGHYHNGLDANAKYEAYFNTAQVIYRVDPAEGDGP
ncbi:unnamed protein product [Clonostachys byssicola]|uniref:DUF1907 domain-containing protein n=1 Tax=Clonostachys byssicola TaxID=160290 RepID=A0A9N9XU15_9HYPO|nr:unnamed protein product [Clonostachys byssicola]